MFLDSTTEIYVNLCSCGWHFPALSKYITKCPQCRDEKKYCQKCGELIKYSNSDNYCKKCLTKKDVYCPCCDKEKEIFRNDFCNRCMNIDKTLKRKNMSKRIEQIKTFKETQERCPHNYDCGNCPEDDCIIPADCEQPELF